MPVLTVVKNYIDNTTLTQAELDQAFQSIETFVNTTKLDSTNLQNGSVITASIAAMAVDSSKIASNAVGASQLSSDSSVDANRAVGTNHLKDASVTVAKLASASVGTSQLIDANVTQAKLAARATGTTVAAGGVAISSSCGVAYGNSTSSYTSVTNLNVTITALGRPVKVALQSDGTTGSLSGFLINLNGSPPDPVAVGIFRDSTQVAEYRIGGSSTTSTPVPASSIVFLDQPAAGTYTYTVKMKAVSTGAGTSASIFNCVLIAYEI
jgi:hypothetical protein